MPAPASNIDRAVTDDLLGQLPGGIGSIAVVHLDRVAVNVQRLRPLLGGRSLWAVVKADAYGLGAVPVAAALAEAGVHGLAVARVEEAAELRRAGLTLPILLLGPPPLAIPALAGVEYTAATYADLERLAAAAVAVHVKVDTGMGRLGFAAADVARWSAAARALGDRWVGLWTHYAQADTPDAAYHRRQRERFAACVSAVARGGRLPPQIHAANSAGTATLAPAETAVRVGLYLYGANPWSVPTATPAPLPVLEWLTRVVSARETAAGTGVSYRTQYTTSAAERLAVVPVGYADGLVAQPPIPPRLWTRRGALWVRGRITMDLAIVGGAAACEGEAAWLIGPADVADAPTVDELARCCGRIAYETLTNLGPRVVRTHVA